MKVLFTVLFIAVFLFLSQKIKAQVNINDSLALVDLYNNTDGGNWNTRWYFDNPVSLWYGVTVENNRVTRLVLGFNELNGTLSGSIGNLTELIVLNLSFNHLSGSIPSSIGNLTKLESLSLDFNQLSGNIPNEIGSLISLAELYLDVNKLSGNIPNEIGNLINLTKLNLSINNLTGSIPRTFGNFLYLTDLDLASNKLAGAIPGELGKLRYLNYLGLNENNLNGEIPFEILQLDRLTRIYLKHNYFTFSGLEGVAEHFYQPQYSHQANITLHNNENLLSVSAGGTLSNNTYELYKDGVLVYTKKADSTFTIYESGKYFVSATNSIVTRPLEGEYLILKTDTLDINVLPLSFLSFSATPQQNKILLNWATANETNNDYFTIERSANNKDFVALGKIAANGKGETENNYFYLDNTPLSGTSYYRIKQTDKDGKFSYSKIISTSFIIQNLQFKITPNPSHTGAFSLDFGETKNNIIIIVTDNAVRKIFTNKLAEAQKINIHIPAVSGTYFIEAVFDGGKENGKLVVE